MLELHNATVATDTAALQKVNQYLTHPIASCLWQAISHRPQHGRCPHAAPRSLAEEETDRPGTQTRAPPQPCRHPDCSPSLQPHWQRPPRATCRTTHLHATIATRSRASVHLPAHPPPPRTTDQAHICLEPQKRVEISAFMHSPYQEPALTHCLQPMRLQLHSPRPPPSQTHPHCHTR